MSFSFTPTETPPEDDTSANEEANALAQNRDLEKEERESKHDRNESFRENIKKAITWLIWVGFGIAVWASGTWAWHLLIPEKYHYLTPDQIDKVQTILFTVAAASGVQAFAKKHV